MASQTYVYPGVLQPRHMTHVFYPCFGLLKAGTDNSDREYLSLMEVSNVRSRYEPRPLIHHDEAIANHAFRNGRGEISIFSISQASVQIREVFYRNMQPLDSVRLVQDMTLAEQCNGSTKLEVLSFSKGWPVHGEGVGIDNVSIRIHRTSRFRFTGAKHTQEDDYEIPYTHYKAIEDPNKQWMMNITDLLEGRSDVAYLHAQKVLEKHNIGRGHWLKSRQPDYAAVLRRNAIPRNAILPDAQCSVCLESMNVRDEIVEAGCDGKHRYHLACLVQVCEIEGAEKSRCPLCRTLLTPDAREVDLLKYGVVGKAYICSEKYDAFENWERSCSDLDKRLAENEVQKIKVKYRLFEAALDMIIGGALLESARSRPYHLQIARCPELALLKEAVLSTTKAMDGIDISGEVLNGAIIVDLISSVRMAYKTGGLMSTMGETHAMEWVQETGPMERMRPGFEAFAVRTISRAIMFALLRGCDCTGPSEAGMHKHGARLYYDPRAEAWSLSRSSEPEEPLSVNGRKRKLGESAC